MTKYMEKKPAEIKKKAPSKKAAAYLAIDRSNLFGWLMSCFIICGCMFFLGVMVGRNTAPVQFDVDRIEQKLSNLQVSVLNQNKSETSDADIHETDLTQDVADITDIQENIKEMSELPIVHDNIIDMLKDKGLEPEIYEQYVPPVLTPKYSKTAPEKKESAAARKKQVAASNDPAPSEPVAVLKPEVSSVSAEAPAPVVTPEKTVAETPAPAAVDPVQKTPVTAGPEFAIQVASLKDPEKARQLMNKFKEKGYPAFCQSSEVAGATWHRVRIGPYPDRELADRDQIRLKAAGVDSLVISMN